MSRLAAIAAILSLASLQAGAEEFGSKRHPCLTSSSVLSTNAKTLRFASPATLVENEDSKYLLDGLVLEFLPMQMEQQKNTLIEKSLGQSEIVIHRSKKHKVDRYNRQKAFLEIKPPLQGQQSERPVLMQERLISEGLARVDLQDLTMDCASSLLFQEGIARKKKKGLWALSDFQPRKANDRSLQHLISTYQIVEGRVLNVSRKENGTSYLNFGRNWQQDFTATLNKKSLMAWEVGNKSLDDLEDRSIYVRGWVEERGGPLIRVQHPLQLGVGSTQSLD